MAGFAAKAGIFCGISAHSMPCWTDTGGILPVKQEAGFGKNHHSKLHKTVLPI